MSDLRSKFATAGEVLRMLPFSATYHWLSQQQLYGDFPISIRVSQRKVLFDKAAVQEWIDAHFPPEEAPAPKRSARRRNA